MDFTTAVDSDVIEEPAHVIASSLSAAHLVEAVHRDPEMFRRLALILPTGLDKLSDPPGIGGTLVNRLFRLPVVGTALYTGTPVPIAARLSNLPV